MENVKDRGQSLLSPFHVPSALSTSSTKSSFSSPSAVSVSTSGLSSQSFFSEQKRETPDQQSPSSNLVSEDKNNHIFSITFYKKNPIGKKEKKKSELVADAQKFLRLIQDQFKDVEVSEKERQMVFGFSESLTLTRIISQKEKFIKEKDIQLALLLALYPAGLAKEYTIKIKDVTQPLAPSVDSPGIAMNSM